MSKSVKWMLMALLMTALGLAAIIWSGLLTSIPSSLHRAEGNPGKTLKDYYEQTLVLNANKPQVMHEATKATFLAVGDISLARNIAATIKSTKDPLYPFRGLNELLKSTDFNFGNLESPFSSSDTFTAKNTLVFNAPKANVAGLKEYNFKMLNLANNHALDQGVDGVITTANVLDENNLLHMGTGKNLDDAWQPAIMEKNGIKIGFIGAAYASVNDGGKTTNDHIARMEDLDRLKTVISNLKPLVDFLVVTMHAGTEYTRQPNQSQIDFAHAAIDAGSDIVIGHHPHWVQEREVYCPHATTDDINNNRELPDWQHPRTYTATDLAPSCGIIYYSLGNFIFDQAWSEQTKQGLALKITVAKDQAGCVQTQMPGCTPEIQGAKNQARLERLEEIPISIKNNCCPVVDIKK